MRNLLEDCGIWNFMKGFVLGKNHAVIAIRHFLNWLPWKAPKSTHWRKKNICVINVTKLLLIFFSWDHIKGYTTMRSIFFLRSVWQEISTGTYSQESQRRPPTNQTLAISVWKHLLENIILCHTQQCTLTQKDQKQDFSVTACLWNLSETFQPDWSTENSQKGPYWSEAT